MILFFKDDFILNCVDVNIVVWDDMEVMLFYFCFVVFVFLINFKFVFCLVGFERFMGR